MAEVLVTVVIPTLEAGDCLLECLASLDAQTFRQFEAIIVDNSGEARVRRGGVAADVLEEEWNVGFGAAINHAAARSRAPYLATLNDDAVAQPRWLEALVEAMDQNPQAGMAASQVRLYGSDRLDSAGMLIGGDGSSRQRGHGEAAADWSKPGEALLPSASAAIYRRSMLERIGGFDEDFFLYCEDTDFGLRARWAGWTCRYVPEAVVEHRYSYSAGRASPLKAYYVERNRLYTALKNFPARCLWRVPFVSAARYCWHVISLLRGQGKAAEFHAGGNPALHLAWYVLKAHLAVLWNLGSLLRKRRRIRRISKLSPSQFEALLSAHTISARRIAEL